MGLALAPMQGLNDAIIYFRPFKRKWKPMRQQRTSQPNRSTRNQNNAVARLRSFVVLRSSYFARSSLLVSSDEEGIDAVVELANLEVESESCGSQHSVAHAIQNDDNPQIINSFGLDDSSKPPSLPQSKLATLVLSNSDSEYDSTNAIDSVEANSDGANGEAQNVSFASISEDLQHTL